MNEDLLLLVVVLVVVIVVVIVVLCEHLGLQESFISICLFSLIQFGSRSRYSTNYKDS